MNTKLRKCTSIQAVAERLFVLKGAINTGVLVNGNRALLFDCCDTVTPERLARQGIRGVDLILCTQHRRTHTAGAYAFTARGARVIVPAAERHLFERPDLHWNDWNNRWYPYHCQPGPLVPIRPLPVHRAVREGDSISWGPFRIRVLETPGMTDGSVSYLVEVDGRRFGFSGDLVYGDGQLWDLYSLQKGYGRIGDYHAFIGSRTKLIASLRKLAASGADELAPSRGEVIRNPDRAVGLAIERLQEFWRLHAGVSALNYYFPELAHDIRNDPGRMPRAPSFRPPGFVRRVYGTSSVLLSKSGAALLIDCASDSVVTTLWKWIQKKVIRQLDGCWVTHYHNDHVTSLHWLTVCMRCPIIADQHLAEIIEYPSRFFLPCISPVGAPVAKRTREGESWRWHEFRLTAFHFPGQTHYHGGLLVEGRGRRLLFAGDSFSPTGLDNYCCGNRNFFGKGRGVQQCIAWLREHRPEFIFNQHQERPFRFSARHLDQMERQYAAQERACARLTPWSHPNFALDEWWVRAYPYEQEAAAGATTSVEVHFTNHGPRAVWAEIAPVLPDGWRWDRRKSAARIRVPARTDGSADRYCRRPDGVARVWITIPDRESRRRFTMPFRITWGDRYLGQFRHAILVVR